jgi:hypothetical protein
VKICRVFYAGCQYAECHAAEFIMLSATIMIIVKLSIAMLGIIDAVYRYSEFTMLSVTMLSTIMLTIVILNFEF